MSLKSKPSSGTPSAAFRDVLDCNRMCRKSRGCRDIGIVLPNDQRQYCTLHIQEDVLPYACASYNAPCQPLSRAFSGWIRSPSPAQWCSNNVRTVTANCSTNRSWGWQDVETMCQELTGCRNCSRGAVRMQGKARKTSEAMEEQDFFVSQQHFLSIKGVGPIPLKIL